MSLNLEEYSTYHDSIKMESRFSATVCMKLDVSVDINQTTKRTFTLAVILQVSIVFRETMISHGHVKPKNYICVFRSNKGKSTSWTLAESS